MAERIARVFSDPVLREVGQVVRDAKTVNTNQMQRYLMKLTDADELLALVPNAQRLKLLEARERHLMDVYAALGVEWGADPFAAIARLGGGGLSVSGGGLAERGVHVSGEETTCDPDTSNTGATGHAEGHSGRERGEPGDSAPGAAAAGAGAGAARGRDQGARDQGKRKAG